MAEISFVEVVDVGPGWNKVRASDGNVYTLKGNYNWRSNNPGNIEYGNFAKSMGAIGSGKPPAGRKRGFAIFPTYEAGMKAQETLQFESPRYRDLTIRDAISRYAPEFENDSAGYAAQLAAAAGVSVDTKLSDLSPAQRRAYLQAQHKVEGFVPGKIAGEDGKPVPASVARQFAAVPLPPKDIPGGSSASVDTSTPSGIRGLQTQLKRMGIDPGPVDGIMGPRTKAAVKEFQQQNGLAVDGIVGPQTSAVLAASGGSASPNRVPATVAPYLSNRTPPPLPRPRPATPSPIADAANITPLSFPGQTMVAGRPDAPVGSMPAQSPLESAKQKLAAARTGGIVDSAQSPRLFAEGVGIPNDQIPGTDATYGAGNRMSTGGLGSLLGGRSVPPATPNPTPWQPTVAGRPSAPGSLPAARPQPTVAGRPDAPVGSMPAARSQTTIAGRPSAPVGSMPAASPTNSASPTQKTAGTSFGTTFQPAVAGSVQMPADARPSAVPKYIPKTVMVAANNDPSAIPSGTTLNYGSRDTVAQRQAGQAAAKKLVPKTIMVLNPAYVAPQPATPSPALSAGRSTNALMTRTPATQSAALLAQRRATPPSQEAKANALRAAQKTGANPVYTVTGQNTSFAPKSVATSTRWLTGY